MITRGIGEERITPNLVMTFALAAGARGARAMDDQGVANVSFGIGNVEEKSLPKGENDLVVIEMAEAVAVIEVVRCSPFALPFGENNGRAVDIGEMC